MQSLGTSVFREMRVLYPVGVKTVEFLTLPSCSIYESLTGMSVSRDWESRLGTSDLETISRCVHWGRMTVEVKLSMDGPSELFFVLTVNYFFRFIVQLEYRAPECFSINFDKFCKLLDGS